MKQPGSYTPYMKPQMQQPSKLVPFTGMPAMAMAGPKPVAPQQTDAEAEAARVQRHRDRQRKKRAFGRTVRYQVCGGAHVPRMRRPVPAGTGG